MDVNLSVSHGVFSFNYSRKTRALTIIGTLIFTLGILVFTPMGNGSTLPIAQVSVNGSNNASPQVVASSNSSFVELDCSLITTFNGSIGNSSRFVNPFVNGSFSPGQFGNGNDFNPNQSSTFGSFPSGSQFFNGTIPESGGAGSIGMGGFQVMSESSYSDISSVKGVLAVAPILQVYENENVSAINENSTFYGPNYAILGVPLSSSIIPTFPVLPSNVTAGRNLRTGDTDSVVISQTNSEYFKAGLGDTITLLGRSFNVVGIYGASSGFNSQAIYMSLSDAQSLTNNTGNITSLKVFVNANTNVTSVITAIKSLHPALSVVPVQNSGALPLPSSTLSTGQSATQSSTPQKSSTSFGFVYVGIIIVVVLLIVAVTLLKKRRKAESYVDEGSSFTTLHSVDLRFLFSHRIRFKFSMNLDAILVNCLILNSVSDFFKKIKGET